LRWVLLTLALACAGPRPDLRSLALARVPSADARAGLRSSDAQTRLAAAIAVGRIADAAAIAELTELLQDPVAGSAAAWALGRIDGGQPALTKCLDAGCPALPAAARASTDIEALLRALHGPAAREAGLALGVLARSKAKFPESTAAQLAESAALLRKRMYAVGAEAGAIYALSRLPKSSAP
jgi:HEAT repeat protein